MNRRSLDCHIAQITSLVVMAMGHHSCSLGNGQPRNGVNRKVRNATLNLHARWPHNYGTVNPIAFGSQRIIQSTMGKVSRPRLHLQGDEVTPRLLDEKIQLTDIALGKIERIPAVGNELLSHEVLVESAQVGRTGR